MDDIAAELGMSKKTLYALFSSKDELVRSALEAKFDEAEGDLDRVTADPSTEFLSALHQLLATMQRHTEEIRPPFVRDIERVAPELFELVDRRRGELIRRHFGKLFAAGRKAGMIRADVPTRMIVEILLGATQAILNPVRMAELGLAPETGYRFITTVILEGAITREGGRS
jgi:AcrR family transcriptional regulator